MNKTGNLTSKDKNLTGISVYYARNQLPTDFPLPQKLQEPSEKAKAWLRWFNNSQYSEVVK